MEYIDIRDLRIGKYRINLKAEDNLFYGVYGKDKEAVSAFLRIIAGIDNNFGTCFYKGEDLFENKSFFTNRLYLDFRRPYLRSLNIKAIENYLKVNFRRSFDIDSYREAVRETFVKHRIDAGDCAKSSSGKASAGYCLLRGLSSPAVIIDHATDDIDRSLGEKILSGLTVKDNYRFLIAGVSDLDIGSKYFDRVIIFSDSGECFEADPETTGFLICSDHIGLRNRIFRKGTMTISLNDYSREELKKMREKGIKYRIASYRETAKIISGEKE